MEKFTYTLKKEDEKLRTRDVLELRLHFSTRLIKKLKYAGEPAVFLDGKAVKLWEKGKAGQLLEANYPEEESHFLPVNIPIDVVYEDEDLLIINKQAGLVVHPTKNFQDNTLANAITYYMQQKGEKYKMRFVNRLDMNTSGLIVVGKNSHAQDFLANEMAAGRFVKIYEAIVAGAVSAPGTVDAPILKDPGHAARRIIDPTGQHSVTHYKPLCVYPAGYSLLELKLETGRTHQIRVHMQYIGHTIVGDELYGSADYPNGMVRQALNAKHIEFIHPVSGKLITADAPMPADMQAFLDRIAHK